MNTIDIQIGDIVYLKSGSPELTVHNVTIDEDRTYKLVCVVWFDDYGRMCSTMVPDICLVADKIDKMCENLIGDNIRGNHS